MFLAWSCIKKEIFYITSHVWELLQELQYHWKFQTCYSDFKNVLFDKLIIDWLKTLCNTQILRMTHGVVFKYVFKLELWKRFCHMGISASQVFEIGKNCMRNVLSYPTWYNLVINSASQLKTFCFIDRPSFLHLTVPIFFKAPRFFCFSVWWQVHPLEKCFWNPRAVIAMIFLSKLLFERNLKCCHVNYVLLLSFKLHFRIAFCVLWCSLFNWYLKYEICYSINWPLH